MPEEAPTTAVVQVSSDRVKGTSFSPLTGGRSMCGDAMLGMKVER
jgi:hypothetical protein